MVIIIMNNALNYLRYIHRYIRQSNFNFVFYKTIFSTLFNEHFCFLVLNFLLFVCRKFIFFYFMVDVFCPRTCGSVKLTFLEVDMNEMEVKF